MQGKKHEDAKKEIRSVLLTFKDSVTLDEFLRTFRNLLGQRLPSRELGFSTDVDFLKSMPDVVDLQSCNGKIYLIGIADKASQHIQKLVSKQRKNKPSNNSNKRSHSNYRQPVNKLRSIPITTKELQPFLPGKLRVEILELMSSYNYALTLSAFALAYHQKFYKYLPLPKGMNSLEAIIKLIPELEVGTNDYKEITISNRRSLKNAENEQACYSKKMLSESPIGTNVVQEKSYHGIHESGISDDILNYFQMMMEKYPCGIQNIHFPPLYEKVSGKPFDIIEFGYNSMADLVEALPHLFDRVPNPDDEKHWFIYPSGSNIGKSFEEEKVINSSTKSNSFHHQEDISADISSASLQYIQSPVPDYVNLSEYIPVFVSAISNPSLFWFQLQVNEFTEKFEKLEKDMENFYSNYCNKYKMSSADIAIGATCVIQCPDDDRYYRAVIKSIPSTDLINVSFVDYGSRNNVPKNNAYYAWSKLHKYPVFAFKAQLDGLKPSGNAGTWTVQARKRFFELCNGATLMSFIKTVDNDVYSMYLCDTNGDEDIYFHDALINEGYAEKLNQKAFENHDSNSTDHEKIHKFQVDPDCSITHNQDTIQSDSSDMLMSDSNESLVNEKLSPYVQTNGVQENSSNFSSDQYSKRYVKEVEVCKDSKIHLINLENKLFMSCGELCNLLWRESNANSLVKRLKHKEISVPFVHLKKEDYSELFEQCLWYKVSSYDKNDSVDSSLILCPLKEAFTILNIFGHPSVCLRIIIQHEMRIFDPHDEFWNEFSYQEFSDLSAADRDILDEINNLCLYDLKAKYEAFQIQKLKLLRRQLHPSTEEISRIENILDIIARRMKQIESICLEYSSCS